MIYKKYTKADILSAIQKGRKDREVLLVTKEQDLEQYVDWVMRLVLITQQIFIRSGRLIPGWLMWTIGILSVRKEIIKLITDIIDKLKNRS